MEDLANYLENVVGPTIADFAEKPTSVRHAFLACVVTFHSVDYLAYPKKSSGLRQKWGRESNAFKIVDKVAHAFKHARSGNPKDATLKARDVISRAGAFDPAAFDRSFDIGAVTLANDPDINMLEIVEAAAAFVRQQLEELRRSAPSVLLAHPQVARGRGRRA